MILFKLNITFYFKCYLHHSCSINLTWNNTQLYSSAKPFRNVSALYFDLKVFVFFHFFAELAFRIGRKTGSVVLCSRVNRSERNVGKDIKVPVSKPVHKSRRTNQSYAQRSRKPGDFEKLYYFVFKFLGSQHKISIFL